MNILLSTLGQSWAVIPEVAALFLPEWIPIYQYHSGVQKQSDQYGSIDELWVITSGGTTREIDQLRCWWQALKTGLPLRIWQSSISGEMDSEEGVVQFRELAFRSVLEASERASRGGGKLYLSLAGGRKTMSADLQKAASVFGCESMFHVIPRRDRLPVALNARSVDEKTLRTTLSAPFPREWVEQITPVKISGEPRSELLDISADQTRPIHFEEYPTPDATDDGVAVSCVSFEGSLVDEVDRRRREGGRLFGNFLQSLAKQEHHENWRMLYRLSPGRIDKLRTTRVDETHMQWLQRIPKSDIHRHLGGCLGIEQQIEVANVVYGALKLNERAEAARRVQPLLKSREWGWNWTALLRPDRKESAALRSAMAATLLVHCDPAVLRHNLLEVTQPRIGLKQSRGFSAYELPGELSGSAILQHEAAILPYARVLRQQADEEGLGYVELRGSPQKYLLDHGTGNGIAFLKQLQSALEGDKRFRFIVIADRRERDCLDDVVQLAVQAREQLNGFVVGVDLAGDEGTSCPQQIAPYFEPAFKACMPITIHAGEGESAENIWQAAYHLHADRIGHGLTLHHNSLLRERFRDRDICIELCPTSNMEVVGFHDPLNPQTEGLPDYPLKNYWDAGVPLTISTDNPGISATTISNEYLVASRMVDGGITQWDALAMIKQGFTRSFLPADQKGEMIKRIDREIYGFLSEEMMEARA